MISNSKLKYFLTVTILSIILFFGLIVGLKLSNNIINVAGPAPNRQTAKMLTGQKIKIL
jgi:hypothetical protein